MVVTLGSGSVAVVGKNNRTTAPGDRRGCAVVVAMKNDQRVAVNNRTKNNRVKGTPSLATDGRRTAPDDKNG